MKYVYEQHSCELCEYVCMGSMKFFQHIKRCHNMTTEEYHLAYTLHNNRPVCLECGGDGVYFKGVTSQSNKGYTSTCSSTCNAKLLSRKRKQKAIEVRSDSNRYANFCATASNATKKVWANRSDAETQAIRAKMFENNGRRLPPGEAAKRRKDRYEASKNKWIESVFTIYSEEQCSKMDKTSQIFFANVKTLLNVSDDNIYLTSVQMTQIDNFCNEIKNWSK